MDRNEKEYEKIAKELYEKNIPIPRIKNFIEIYEEELVYLEDFKKRALNIENESNFMQYVINNTLKNAKQLNSALKTNIHSRNSESKLTDSPNKPMNKTMNLLMSSQKETMNLLMRYLNIKENKEIS